MTWTTPRTWVTGEIVIASQMNTDVRDNTGELKDTVQGDGGATLKHRHLTGTNASRPAAGELGRTYQATDNPKCLYGDDGTNWQIIGGDVPKCRVYRATSQVIDDDTATPISFSAERFDNDSMWAVSPNPTRITFTKPGTYLMGANIAWGASDAGRRVLTVHLNGTTTIASTQVEKADSVNHGPNQAITTLYAVAAAAYVECVVRQNRGGTLSCVASANFSPEFWAIWMAP